jgi:hypothetical protein
MGKVLFFVVGIAALYLTIAAFPSSASAQGTYKCTWAAMGMPQCRPIQVNCEDGYRWGGECAVITNPGGCTSAGPFTCIEDTQCGSLGDPCCANPPPCNTGLTCIAGLCADTSAPGNQTALCAGGEAIDSAIGCIPVKTNSAFLVAITAWAVRIAAGIAFIMIVVAGFLTMTAGGDPQKVQAARELLTAAITGLLLILLSGFLLRTIGVDLLGIPGL